MKKNLLFTFDYELFLGDRSGSVNNCIIKPTDLILDTLEKNRLKAIFFIDTIYLKRMEELANSNDVVGADFRLITSQFFDICRRGHYLFHHIHPHWLDAAYVVDENQWSLKDTSRFALCKFSEEERVELFQYSNDILTRIIHQSAVKILPEGYRAGGFYIEPFENVKNCFLRFNIKYDFSVVPGDVLKGSFSYDFSKCPGNSFYRFNHLTKTNCDGRFIEFPVSRIRINGLPKIFNSLYYRLKKGSAGSQHFGDGCSADENNIKSERVNKKIYEYFYLNFHLCFEILNPVLVSQFKRIIRKSSYLHFISHPKLLSPNSMKSMGELLEYCTRKFEIESDFKMMISSGT